MTACHAAAIQHNRNFLALFDIWRSGYDLHRLRLSNVYLTNDQFICIRMFFYFLNLSDHDVAKIFVKRFISFCFRTGQRHGVRIFLRRRLQSRHQIFDPL